jgi:hypothetical protein
MTPKIGRRLTDAETEKVAMLAAYIDASPHEWPKGVADIALLCHGYLDLQAALAEAREDSKRMDYLEGEMAYEQRCIEHGQLIPSSLFRRNVPITRAAIDAARTRKP